jgi:hypothetical protein
MTETVTKEQFIERFVKYVTDRCPPTFDDGSSVEQYARDTAPTYYDEPDQRADGPEECAYSDMSYWGED